MPSPPTMPVSTHQINDQHVQQAVVCALCGHSNEIVKEEEIDLDFGLNEIEKEEEIDLDFGSNEVKKEEIDLDFDFNDPYQNEFYESDESDDKMLNNDINLYSAASPVFSDTSIEYEVDDLLEVFNQNQYQDLIDFCTNIENSNDLNEIISYLKEAIEE
jgi:hypothetical protein